MTVNVVDGDRRLPSGYPHPHASEEARTIAEHGMILRVQVGPSSGPKPPTKSSRKSNAQQRLTQVTRRLRLIESREVEETRDLLELRPGKGARWFE